MLYLEPINGTAVDEWWEHSKSVPEGVTDGTHGKNHVQVTTNALDEEIVHGKGTGIYFEVTFLDDDLHLGKKKITVLVIRWYEQIVHKHATQTNWHWLKCGQMDRQTGWLTDRQTDRLSDWMYYWPSRTARSLLYCGFTCRLNTSDTTIPQKNSHSYKNRRTQ